MPVRSLRDHDDDPPSQRLAAAFLISLLAHSAFFGILQIGSQLNWWDSSPFSMFHKVRLTPEEVARLEANERRAEEEREKEQQELIFVQVTAPTEAPPESTPFYSSDSSRASNPDPGREKQTRLDGKQTKILRTEDVPRSLTGTPLSPRVQPQPPEVASLSRSAPVEPPPALPEPEPVVRPETPKLVDPSVEPERQPGIGDLAMVQPEVSRPPPLPDNPRVRPESKTIPERPPDLVEPAPAVAPPTHTRPKTVAEAKLRQELLDGQKFRQEGGVPNEGPRRLDVQGKMYGSYDEALIMAVKNRWYTLLDQTRFAGGGTGRVVINFRLYSDGSVSIVEPTESNVDAFLESLCVRAVRDPAPYAAWPTAMLREVGRKYREIRFTFYYD